MFESAELGHAIDKETLRREEPQLREALLDAQYELLEKGAFPVSSSSAASTAPARARRSTCSTSGWTRATSTPTRSASRPTRSASGPRMWRFWRALPPQGQDRDLLRVLVHASRSSAASCGEMQGAGLDQAIEEIVRFEQMLADEGALLLKFWFHLSKEQQKKRLKGSRRTRRRAGG